jgi:ribonuclease P protein component
MDTIKSSREIDAIFRGAKRATHPLLIVLAAQTPERRGRAGRVAFVAGKRMGGAVARNRSRRVLRATTHRAGGPWPEWDVVLISRQGTAQAAPEDMDRALADALKRTGVA